jgi:hypothetical protein
MIKRQFLLLDMSMQTNISSWTASTRMIILTSGADTEQVCLGYTGQELEDQQFSKE